MVLGTWVTCEQNIPTDVDVWYESDALNITILIYCNKFRSQADYFIHLEK